MISLRRPVGRLLAVCLVACLLAPGRGASAQGAEQDWSEPTNLSRSGGTARPALLVDPSGGLHAVWQDIYADLVYVHNAGGGWETPVALDLPFADYETRFVADGTGWMHALWIDEELDLRHQRVRAESFGVAESWQAPATLAGDVVTFAATLDANNGLQLAYVRGREASGLPAGIYALRSEPSGTGWSTPLLVFQSPYFRTLLPPDDRSAAESAGQSTLAHVAIATAAAGGGAQVYITWDHPALKRVYLGRSVDGGRNWGEATVIDGPEDAAPYKLPQRLRVSANGAEVLLIWDAAVTGGFCTAAYRASHDGGETWTAAGELQPGATTCPESLQALPQADGTTVVLTSVQSQAALMVWDGQRWSTARGQAMLNGFFDGEGFRFVQLGCLQAAQFQGQLYATGCDESGGGDIWFTSRPLGASSDWFGLESGWSSPVMLAVGPVAKLALAASVEAGGRLHVLWAQAEPEDDAAANLFHAAWGAEGLAGPFEVLSGLRGPVNDLEAATDLSGRLVAVWSGGPAQAVQFSWVDAAQASNPDSWSRPEALFSADTPGQPARPVFAAGAQVYAAYAVPLNEGRGVYVARSDDRGLSWRAPVQVFDGTGAGCPLVGQPSLIVTPGSQVHVGWACAGLPGGAGPLALYQARSQDGGETWLPAERAVDGPVTWNQLAAGPGGLHRVWLQAETSGASLWHASSGDEGNSWSSPANLGLVEGEVGPASLAVDPAGRLHWLLALQDSVEGWQVRYWRWDGTAWTVRERLSLGGDRPDAVVALDSGVDPAGRLMAVFARPGVVDAAGTTPMELGFSALPIAASGGGITPAATPAATGPAPTALPAASPIAATAAPTTAAPNVATPETVDSPNTNGPVLGLILGAVSAAVLVIGVAVVGVLRNRRS